MTKNTISAKKEKTAHSPHAAAPESHVHSLNPFAPENKIRFLKEKDFLPVMETENRRWRKEHVKNGHFTTRDGVRMNYYYAEHPHPRAVIVMIHGFCCFWGKYHEYAWYLWQAGYSIFFMEQRGHGYSGGKLRKVDLVHIDHFETYLKDMREFMDKVVVPASGKHTRLMLGHSMGGAVGAAFLGTWPKYFDAAILTSPMLKVQTGGIPPAVVQAVKVFTGLTRCHKRLFFGMQYFDPEPQYVNDITVSKARYIYFFRQRIFDPHYRTTGATFGWVLEALRSNKLIMARAHRIKIPVTLMQAGIDTLVSPEGFDEFMARVPQAKKYYYADSKHEIFNAGDKVRIQYFRDVLREFGQMSAK